MRRFRLFPFLISNLLFIYPAGGHAGDLLLKTEALQSLLGIPTEMAVVKDGYVPGGQRYLHYVLIEDAHESPEAQGKIAAILLYAHHHWGSRQAFIEGAFGPIGPPPFPIFTPERGDRGILELLQVGMCSAGELAAAISSRLNENRADALVVAGMDDPFLYRAQLEAFEDLASVRPSALRDLEQKAATWTLSERENVRRLVSLSMSPAAYHRYVGSKQPVPLNPVLSRAVDRAQVYYRLADQRSKVFADTTRRRRVGNGPCLLVMGGFHTPAIARALRERRESFIVLSPRLTQPGFHRIYERCLAQSLRTLRRLRYDSHSVSLAGLMRLSLARQSD